MLAVKPGTVQVPYCDAMIWPSIFCAWSDRPEKKINRAINIPTNRRTHAIATTKAKENTIPYEGHGFSRANQTTLYEAFRP